MRRFGGDDLNCSISSWEDAGDDTFDKTEENGVMAESVDLEEDVEKLWGEECRQLEEEVF